MENARGEPMSLLEEPVRDVNLATTEKRTGHHCVVNGPALRAGGSQLAKAAVAEWQLLGKVRLGLSIRHRLGDASFDSCFAVGVDRGFESSGTPWLQKT